MKIFGFHITRQNSQAAGIRAKSLGPDSDAWLRGQERSFDGPLLSNAYQQVVWVYRAVNVLAEQIGNIPFLFSSGDRGRENLITTGPLAAFYEHPHPNINRFQYWELRIMWLMLRGECFRIPIYEPPSSSEMGTRGARPSGERRLSRVLILDPAQFQHIIEDHQLIGWRYTGLGPQTPLASQVFLPEEVWFEKLPNPFNFWRGLAPLQVAAMAAQTDFAAGAFMKGLLENNGDLGLVVRVQEPLGPEQREQLIAALRQRKRRAGAADQPLLLANAAEIVQPTLSSSDLQFLENRKFSRAEICAAFGVPEEIVTTTDHSKYDVMQGARLNFVEHRIGPLCRRLEAGEEPTVRSLDARAVGWFDLDSLPIMQKAQRDRLATAREVFDMGVPFNELNRVLDLGFRRLAWGDRGYVASKLTEVGEDNSNQSTQAARAQSRSKKPSEGATLLQAAEKMAGFLSAAPAPALEERATPVPIHLVQQSDPGKSAGHTFSRKLRRFFFEQRGRALAVLAAKARGTSGAEEDWTLLDSEVEKQKLNAVLTAAGEGEGGLREQAERLNRLVMEGAQAALEEGFKRGERPEQLAGRIRAFYNHNDHQRQKNQRSGLL